MVYVGLNIDGTVRRRNEFLHVQKNEDQFYLQVGANANHTNNSGAFVVFVHIQKLIRIEKMEKLTTRSNSYILTNKYQCIIEYIYRRKRHAVWP